MAASLYWKHFGLNAAPFPATPADDAYYSGGSRKATLDALLHVLRNESGIVKIVGESGTGKTTLCRRLMRELRQTYTVVYTCDPTLGDDQTWFALADSLRLPVDRANPSDAAARVRARLAQLHAAGRPVLLLVDEAHALAPATREQLRLLAQRNAGAETMRIVLLGPDELDHDLALPGMEALRSRIVHAFRLKRLTLSDIDEYLRFRMRAAGWSGEPVFNANAVKAIARLTGGIPRRINVVADKALLSAALERRHEVGGRDVAAAADEIKLSRRRAGAPSWRVAGLAFAGGIVATAAIATVAWHLLRPGVPDGAAAAVPPTSTTAAPSTSSAPAAISAPSVSPAPAATSARPASPAPSAAAAPSRTGDGTRAAGVVGAPPQAPAAAAPAGPSRPAGARGAAEPGPAPLTLGELPSPRFVQDTLPAKRDSN